MLSVIVIIGYEYLYMYPVLYIKKYYWKISGVNGNKHLIDNMNFIQGNKIKCSNYGVFPK